MCSGRAGCVSACGRTVTASSQLGWSEVSLVRYAASCWARLCIVYVCVCVCSRDWTRSPPYPALQLISPPSPPPSPDPLACDLQLASVAVSAARRDSASSHPGRAYSSLPTHQRLSSSPYRRAQSQREIAQGARWVGLTAPGCALCGRKSLLRCTLGWHRRAPKARLELRLVGAPWDITGAPGEVRRRTLAGLGSTQAGYGRTPKAHLELCWVRPGPALG
jgi:hypothetical protein